jgi:hypothetical protein
METWYYKVLGDGAAAFAPSHRIQNLFLPMYVASDQPSSMAVFSRYDREANEVTAYFSPGASKLAVLFNAKPCEKPSGDRIGLLVGGAQSWDMFFPDRKRRAA